MKTMLLFTIAAVLLPIGTAHADGPRAKEGLWLLNRQTIDNPGGKKDVWAPITVCLSNAYNEYVQQLAKNIPGCSTVNESTHGNTRTVEAKCVIGKTVLDTKGTTTMESETVHAESHTTYTPPMNGKSETIMVSDSKYLGSCPAGMQPGDRKNADGTISHSNWKH